MTEPAAPTPPPLDDTDVKVDPDDLERGDAEPDDLPATSDPDSFTDDAALGGVGGASPGGAG
jgi:hypothetical protein